MEWINVKNKLPELGQEVLCLCIDSDPKYSPNYYIGQYGKDPETKEITFLEWDNYCSDLVAVECSYWMPLPELPKQEKYETNNR